VAIPSGSAEGDDEGRDEALDFLVIGAPKAGTTSLFEYLRGHPEIDLPPDKEAPYFSDDRIYGKLAWDDYLRWAFPTPKRGRLAGTITPQYMSAITPDGELAPNGEAAHEERDDRALPRRIHERLPSARLIAILRDPVERAYSHHTQEARRGNDTRSFAEAVDELLQLEALAHSRRHATLTNCYVVLGEYGRILAAYYEHFPRDRVMVLSTDGLAREPMTALRRIYDFLEVDPEFEPRNLGKRYNVSGTKLKLPRELPTLLPRMGSSNPLTRAIWRTLSDQRRSAVLSGYRRFNLRFRAWNRRQAAASRPSPEVEATFERLRDHYAPDERRLAELLGEDVPPWRAT